jgi:predicted nucleic acid-binding protein
VNRPIVIDASVAVAAFRDDARRNSARKLFAIERELAAPALLLAEAANALWLDARAPGGDLSTSANFLERLARIVRLEPLEGLTTNAFEIACALDHPAYDSYYLALAQREGTVLVTFDERLLNKARATAYGALVADAKAFTAAL